MLPISMIQSRASWRRGKRLKNIRLFGGSAPMPDTAKRLSRIFPENWALGLIFQRGSSRNGKSFQNAGLSNALWLGLTIPDVFLRIMKFLLVPLKLYASFRPFTPCLKDFTLLVQLLRDDEALGTHLFCQRDTKIDRFRQETCRFSFVPRKPLAVGRALYAVWEPSASWACQPMTCFLQSKLFFLALPRET